MTSKTGKTETFKVPHYMPGAKRSGMVEIGATPKQWLAVAAQATTFVNKIADRRDLVVSMGPNAAKIVGTAYFMEATGEIVVNTETMVGGKIKPEHIDLTDSKSQLRVAKMLGGLVHEAAHARFSTATPLALTNAGFSKREVDVATVLEESRIEAQILRSLGSHTTRRTRLYLRRMTTELLAHDFTVADTAYGASMGAALTLARMDSGSVSKRQGAVYRAALLDVLTPAQLNGLRKLWQEYQGLHTGLRGAPMGELHPTFPLGQVKRIVQDWIALVVDPAAADDDADLATGGSGPGEGTPGESSEGAEGSGEGSKGESDEDESSEGEGSLSETLEQIGREDAVDADTDIADEVKDEVTREKLRDAETDTVRRGTAKDAERKAFSKSKSITHGATSSGGSYLVRSDAPTGDHRAAATILSRELAKIVTHDRVTTHVTSIIPPGRVRGRAAVLGSAQLANGQMVTARPFGSTKRKHVETDKVKIAVLSDISGSMSSAMLPLAIMNYVIANAADKIGAEFCSVLFGTDVLSMVKPGERVSTINVMEAGDGYEAIKPAMLAADGALDLLDSTGARVLIINTDAHLVAAEHATFAADFVRLAESRGVTVIWASYGEFTRCHGGGVHVPLGGVAPVQAAAMLGREIVKAVKASQTGVLA